MTRLARLVPGLTVAALLTGCIDLPQDGPVVDAEVTGEQSEDPVSSIDARLPQPGDSRLEVVRGFLDAMTAWPISPSVAKEYLTDDAAAEWSPDSTVIYTELATPREDGSLVSIPMRDAARLDESGGWRGAIPAGRSTLEFRLTVEDGEFRILDPMDALVVRRSWFQDRYRQASLYYFDPTWQVLVPEPVFVPVGNTFATNLVDALLAGPPARLRDVVDTFVPPGLETGLSVPVIEGVAALDLKGDAPRLSSAEAELMLAQLAATLAQEPTISALRVTIDGEEVDPPGAAAQYDVDTAAAFDPTGSGSSGVLYGVRRGRLVSGVSGDMRAIDGPLGRRRHRLASFAVDPDGDQVAVVTADRGQVLLSPLRSQESDKEREIVVAEGADLAQPSWDASGRLWVLDRGRRGARLLVADGGRAREVAVAGVTGTAARRILVSRDGTRLVALVERRGEDRLVAARVVLDERGQVTGAVDATVIHTVAGRAMDLAWTGATELAILTPARPGELYEVETVAADGATVGVDTLSRMVSGRVVGLAGEPSVESPVYGVARDRLVDIRTDETLPLDRVRNLDYAG